MSRLSQYFTGVAVKRLSAVETDPTTSNQHEFNGITAMSEIFGQEKTKFNCSFLYLGQDEEETVSTDGFMTWYDSRKNHPTRTEYRFYYQGNNVMQLASEGDLLVIGYKADSSILTLIVKQGTTYERQVLWLFNIQGENGHFVVSTIEGQANKKIGYAERIILETIGEEIDQAQEKWIDNILAAFGPTFPSTRDFSTFARSTLPDVSSLDDPDSALMMWIDQEEMLFRTLERHLVEEKIRAGFPDVDIFISFSLSVHNRRKSRMGYALENHLEQIFMDHDLGYSREKATENKSKPDFIFPGIAEYHDPDFPSERLSMLGAKSSCKDRWRQVLAEAARIEEKHLITLEPGISISQTDEMKSKSLQLILPQQIHETYLSEQQEWLINLSTFLAVIETKQ